MLRLTEKSSLAERAKLLAKHAKGILSGTRAEVVFANSERKRHATTALE